MAFFMSKNKNPAESIMLATGVVCLLAHKDSNPEKQYQKLLCYHYTMGHQCSFSKAGQRYVYQNDLCKKP